MIPSAALRHRVTVEPYEGPTGAGGEKFGRPQRNVRALVTGKRRAVKTSAGVDVISSATCIMRPSRAPVALSRITHRGRTFSVLDVADMEEYSGPHHTELALEGPL